MDASRLITRVVAVVLLAAVGAAAWVSFSEQSAERERVDVVGYTGSENLPYFRDERSVERFRTLGFSVDARKAGSREIATTVDLSGVDFVMPSGVPAAEKIRHQYKAPSPLQPFYSVMAVASWQNIAEILAANGMAEQHPDGYWLLHMDRYLETAGRKVRWADLEQSDGYAASKRLLINSTDLRHSNSAAMYAALASYVLNGGVLETAAAAQQEADVVADLFLGQGYTEHSSAGPFEDYLVMGAGKAPLVMVYESQYLEEAVRPDSRIRPDMVLMYPVPTIFTERQFVAFTDAAARLGEAMVTDDELQAIAVDYGFRTRNPAAFESFVADHGLKVPKTFVDVVNAPAFEVMETLIDEVAARY